MIIPGTFIWFPLNLAQDIAHDHDIESEDWHIAIEALCEVIGERKTFDIYIYMFVRLQNIYPFCVYET